ncbi:MAG: hypothetical protein BTN85_1653 [Candidatus Methanohalarchaeum thermophilum]|uniref:Uncharacterized protein n=1 Tax=Methanohalarchaeum thermophilum TaxID=1903181 RepID=A0A1Q6DXQ3_METT1|nr:MAG: hypothetical protein BTN85_1653 [Candidatus Methanohalarchaeum thermophilum]
MITRLKRKNSQQTKGKTKNEKQKKKKQNKNGAKKKDPETIKLTLKSFLHLRTQFKTLHSIRIYTMLMNALDGFDQSFMPNCYSLEGF